MTDREQTLTAESTESRAGYEPPSIVIIGPLDQITLGPLSKNGDMGSSGFRNNE